MDGNKFYKTTITGSDQVRWRMGSIKYYRKMLKRMKLKIETDNFLDNSEKTNSFVELNTIRNSHQCCQGQTLRKYALTIGWTTYQKLLGREILDTR